MSFFDVFVDGQSMENYGSHAWDGDGECPQYWKCKGGNRTRVLCKVSFDDLITMLNVISEQVSTGAFNIANEYYSFDAQYVEYFPHGATDNVMTMVEYGILQGAYGAYMPYSEADVEMAVNFRKFMGKDRPEDESEAAEIFEHLSRKAA